MNMNKKILLYLVCIITFCLFNINVYAEEDCSKYGCATCVYKTQTFSFSYDVKADGNGSANVNFSFDSNQDSNSMFNASYKAKQSLVARNFINSQNKLVCPNILYQKTTAGGVSNNRASYSVSIQDNDADGYSAVNLSSESTNNGLSVSDSDTAARACTYNTVVGNSKTPVKLTVTVVNGTLKYELPNGYTMANGDDSLTVEDFSGDSCPGAVFSCGCSGNNCSCRLTKSDGSYWDERQEQDGDEEENTNEKFDRIQLEECEKGYEKDKEGNCIAIGNVAEDPCGENDIKKVLRFFGYLLLIARVAIPLIIIGFATFDLVKSVVDKDEKSFGKQVKMIIIRVISGLVVFFVPNIVYAIFGLSDALNIINGDEYQTCANCLLKPTSECSVSETTTESN